MGFGKLDAPMRAAAARARLESIGPPQTDRKLLRKLESIEDYEGCARHLELAHIRQQISLVSASMADPRRLSMASLDA